MTRTCTWCCLNETSILRFVDAVKLSPSILGRKEKQPRTKWLCLAVSCMGLSSDSGGGQEM